MLKEKGEVIVPKNLEERRLEAACRALAGRESEAVIADEHGVSQCDKLGERIHDASAFAYAFALLIIDDEDVRQLPIGERKARLAELCSKRKTSGIRLSEHLEGDGPTIFEHVCRMGLEGIVSKRIGSRYKSGRCAAWIKTKNPQAAAVLRIVKVLDGD